MTRSVFVDSFHWIAEINPRDEWHARCVAERTSLHGRRLVTSEEVLSEVMDFLSGLGPAVRDITVRSVLSILEDPAIDVIPQSHEGFMDALRLYEARRDKRYSMTDCSSMAHMKRAGIVDVLTNDRHFSQEGFVALLT
jgi:predicted nucleic acid-binding protein